LVRLLAPPTIAGADLPVHFATRNAVVSGYVRLCGGPARGGCRIETLGICAPPNGLSCRSCSPSLDKLRDAGGQIVR
jgi:hypothetical protein